MKEYNILVIDDSTEILEVLELTLSEDYRVFKAESAQEALDIISKQDIDLIIAE